ncbi:MAG: Ldh family oxidoreductase [Pseudomonadota bacterium]
MAGETLGSDEVEAIAVDALIRAGVARSNAAAVARGVAAAEAFGMARWGFASVPALADAVERGLVDGAARCRVTRPRLSLVLADAAGGFAEPAIEAAMEDLATAARETAVAILAVRDAAASGWLGSTVEALATRGLAGLAIAAAPRSDSSMGGSAQPVLGLPDRSGDGGRIVASGAVAGAETSDSGLHALATIVAAGVVDAGQIIIAIDPAALSSGRARAAPVALSGGLAALLGEIGGALQPLQRYAAGGEGVATTEDASAAARRGGDGS